MAARVRLTPRTTAESFSGTVQPSTVMSATRMESPMSSGLMSTLITFRNLVGETDHRKAAVHEVEATTVPDTHAGTGRGDRKLDPDRLVREDLQEVEVDDAIGHRVELDVLHDAVIRRAADLEGQTVRIRGEDQLVQLDLVHVEVNLLGAAVQHARDLALGAEFGCILLPYALTGRAAQ